MAFTGKGWPENTCCLTPPHQLEHGSNAPGTNAGFRENHSHNRTSQGLLDQYESVWKAYGCSHLIFIVKYHT